MASVQHLSLDALAVCRLTLLIATEPSGLGTLLISPIPRRSFQRRTKVGAAVSDESVTPEELKQCVFFLLFFSASAGTVTFALKRTSQPVLGSLLARVCVYNAELSGRPVSIRFRMVAELDSLLTCPACEETRAWSSTPSGG